MLQATTKEQRKRIFDILKAAGNGIGSNVYMKTWEDYFYDDGVSIESDDPYCTADIDYDTMAEIVDYLRSINKPKKDVVFIVDEPMQKVVDTWLKYKKEKGQSYKPTGFKTFYKKLCEMSGNNPQTAMAIIEQSMQNNYSGIFPLRNNNNNNNYGRETITEKIRRTVEDANAFGEQLLTNIGNQTEMGFGDNSEVW